MSRELRREVVDCLRIAGSSDEQWQQLERFGARDWQSILAWLHLSGIAMIFYDRARQAGMEHFIPRVAREALSAGFALQRRRVNTMMEEFASLNRRFDDAGVEYAVVKGFSLIPDYCPNPFLRPTYDYDYLIAEDAAEEATRVLNAAGYYCKPGHATIHSVNFTPPFAPVRRHRSQQGAYSPALPRKVELHFRLWDDEACGITITLPKGFLARRRKQNCEGANFPALAEDDAFLFQTLHVFHHILYDWCRLGWLWEIAYFVESRSGNALFWKTLARRIETNDGLAEVVALVLMLARKIFGANSLERREEVLFRKLRSQLALWVDRYGEESALDNFSRNKYALFLYQEFVSDESTWRRIKRNRLLPFHRPNHVDGAASSGPFSRMPATALQGAYIARRLFHHLFGAAGYAWESMRWERLRRQRTGHVLTVG